MTGFQWIGLAVVAGPAALTLASLVRRQGSRASALAWLCLWCAAITALLWPDLTRIPAQLLGVQRGVDLVLYCAVLGMLGGFFLVSIRLREVSREITLLVRQLALEDAQPGVPARKGSSPEADDWDGDADLEATTDA